MNMYDKLVCKEKKIAVIGLGYVGLPIALAFAKKVSVIGFDINSARIEMMRRRIDPSEELVAKDFEDTDIVFTDNPSDLKSASFYIVAVPTPIDAHKTPNLYPLLSACRTVGAQLSAGDYVVFESTVYPGCTEDDCVPILEEVSGLRAYQDFKVGYSPERINPGDKVHTLAKITKVVAGNDAAATTQIAQVYKLVVDAGVFEAASIKVAEAAKVIENTQRDLNIALMNELSHIFRKLGINTYDVLRAAGTKWNFLPFHPGLVGGHCIGVDPYYLTYKAKSIGYMPEVILSGRRINDQMGQKIAKQIVQKLAQLKHNLSESKVLIMGVTFKENVADIRNTKVIDLVEQMQSFGLQVEITDPHANAEAFRKTYGQVLRNPSGKYQAIVLAVAHQKYLDMPRKTLENMAAENCLLVDIKGRFSDLSTSFHYWSL